LAAHELIVDEDIFRNITHMTLKKHQQNLTIALLYLAACCYLILLVSSTQPDIFYSGDGGLKFMAIKQICAGEDFRYLSHTQPGWVNDIWAQGFFPIEEPFTMHGPKGYYFVFAPPFQILSAVGYREFGYTGLYIIPFVSVLLLWYWFIRTARQLGFTAGKTALLFFLLAFCSPLTFYGAVYWEHSLAVLLLFGAIYFIQRPTRNPWRAAILGLMSGLAMWVRPEALLLNIFFGGAILLINYRKLYSAHWAFAGGVLAGTLSFLLFNKIEYGMFFGIHGSQVLGNLNYFAKLRKIAGNIYHINWLFIRYFSIILLLIPVLYAWLKLKWPLSAQTMALLLVIVAFCFSGPLIFPNDGGKQWGPRFFLPLIPLTLLLLADIYTRWGPAIPPLSRKLLMTFTVLAIGYTFILNTVIETRNLRNDNLKRILPALDYVRADSGNAVVVNSDFVTMELAALYREKKFFLAQDTAGLKRLIPLLKKQGIDHFIYVNDDETPNGLDQLLSAYQVHLVHKGNYQVGLFHVQ